MKASYKYGRVGNEGSPRNMAGRAHMYWNLTTRLMIAFVAILSLGMCFAGFTSCCCHVSGSLYEIPAHLW